MTTPDPFHLPISPEAVRDLAASLDDWFPAGEVVWEFDVSPATATRYLAALVAAGTLERRGVRAGTRYRIAPLPEAPARASPRRPRATPAQRQTARAVPLTGRPRVDGTGLAPSATRKAKQTGRPFKRRKQS